MVPAARFAASSAPSNASSGTPYTVLPNMWIRRRYASQANRSSPLCAINPAMLASVSPTLRIVSIMPGMENFAPERTDSSNGSRRSPRSRPIRVSSSRRCSPTCSASSTGSCPVRKYTRHAPVDTMKPGGTGNPSRVISHRLAPLPPSRSRWYRLPSTKS